MHLAYWSIAKTKNRETEASGMGWELFKNYVIARDKFRPDYFLYENNKSMSPKIRAQITEMLGVEPVLINSALVSAQNRPRLYWVGKRNAAGGYDPIPVEQPEDRGILLRDVLGSGVCWREKAYTLKAQYYKTSIANGMADNGHIALDNLGADIRHYWATEIDKYAIKTATHNFPDIVELGDAFQVREEDWRVCDG